MNRCTARRPVGARLGSSRRPAGVRPGALRCTVFVLRRPRILYSMPPWGGPARAILYIKRTPDGRRPTLYIAPGTLEGPLRGPQDSRAAPLTTARRPSFYFTIIDRKNGLTVRWKRRENREQPAQHRPNGQMKTPGESGAASSAPRRAVAPVRLVKNVPVPVGTVREPAGHRTTKLAKMSVFTRRTGPGVDMWLSEKFYKFEKNRKPVARRHVVGGIAQSPHGHHAKADPRTDSVRFPCGDRTLHGNCTDIARFPYNLCIVSVRIYPGLPPRSRRRNRTMPLR